MINCPVVSSIIHTSSLSQNNNKIIRITLIIILIKLILIMTPSAKYSEWLEIRSGAVAPDAPPVTRLSTLASRCSLRTGRPGTGGVSTVQSEAAGGFLVSHNTVTNCWYFLT